MKQLSIYFLALLILASCAKDETMVQINKDLVAPQITSQSTGFSKIITADNTGDAVSIYWKAADYGVTTPVTYVLEIDSAGRSFAGAFALGTTSADTVVITLAELNDRLLNNIKVTPNVESTLELRVRASLNNSFPVVSDVITIKITPYKKIEVGRPATLWVPGAYQGWAPDKAPVILATSENVYEGYVYINAGSGFKFTSSPDWDHINYGDSGTPGVLSTDGLANSLGVGVAGYYKFNVDTDKLTYGITLVSTFGIIGTATPDNWDSSTAMTYDIPTDKWSITIDLKAGALKFRANNDWGLNYGPADSDALTGTLIQTDAAISVPADGNYTVTFDVSKATAPYLYSYKVVKN